MEADLTGVQEPQAAVTHTYPDSVLCHVPLVNQLARENRLSRLTQLLNAVNIEARRFLISQTPGQNNPVLFTASLQGNAPMVKYLLEECDPDIEQRGVYVVEDDASRHHVTPLWCAAVANHLDVVSLLVQQGANVNSPSDSESTPVRSACFMTNTAIVRYLVSQGADIHQANVNGGTCLINSVQSVDLCRFLLENGGRVNSCDNAGNVALHYAIREDRMDTVKLLVEWDTDVSIKNDFGDNALQSAAIRGACECAEYLIDATKPNQEAIIHAYELLGANAVDDDHDFILAKRMWRKAMSLRYSNCDEPILKVLPEVTKSVHNNVCEPRTIDELSDMDDNSDILYMQSLLIRERILGPHHRDTAFCLMFRGAVYADTGQYQRCVDLWKHVILLRRSKKEYLSHDLVFTIQQFVRLLWEIEQETVNENVCFSDAFEIFQILADEIRGAKELRQISPVKEHHMKDFQTLLRLYLLMICLFLRLKLTDKEEHKYLCDVASLVNCDPRGWHGESLLHLAVQAETLPLEDDFHIQLPSLAIIKILLACGANLHALDCERSTPFHYLLLTCDYPTDSKSDLVEFLLENGSHLDFCNNASQTPLSLLYQKSFPISALRYITLKCLASQRLISSQIPYENRVPRTLIPFIEMHCDHANIKKD